MDLPKVQEYIRDRYVAKRTSEIESLNANKASLGKTLCLVRHRIHHELSAMYEIRNKIIHGAEYDHEYVIHYTLRLREIMDLVMDRVIFHLQFFPERTVRDILTRSKLTNGLLLEKLVSDPTLDLHDPTLLA
jgi:hypothetical protein